MKPVRLVVVDDSSFVRRALSRLLGEHEEIELVATAASGEELLERLDAWRPDVVTLDLAMPGIGGLATLDRLSARRETARLPVIVLSTQAGPGAPRTIEALHRGAVDFVDKQAFSLVDFQALRNVLVEKILSVGRRWPPEREPGRPAPLTEGAVGAGVRLIALGASTGGPPALGRILTDLGDRVPVPVVVAQHMPAGFTAAFASRLNARLPLSVVEASHGRRLVEGTVYLAQGGRHLTVAVGDGGLELRLELAAGTGPSPSVDRLFESVAATVGSAAVGVVLTGMGSDGARGLLELYRRGARTWVQDEATSVVFGMPGAARRVGAAREEIPLGEIGGRLRRLLAAAEARAGRRC